MLGSMGVEAIRQTAHGERRVERPAGESPVEVVTGADAVARRLLRLRLSAAEEVCAMLTGGPGVLTRGPWSAAPDKGGAVRHRTVVERLGRPGPAAGARSDGGVGLIRVVERIPAELVMADRRVALLPLASADGCAALVVHSGRLLDRLVDLFEDVWHEGRPPGPVPAAVDGPDATDLDVLTLLLAGLTDASVAKQLGLGLRTVQRRVKRLMELAGVTTRLQLGWHAAERGWTTTRR
ncbi:LuxR family transcriptional regulator [Streptomyces sp. SCA3-4]|uniref:winged helix-turn-helix transcriptional regulator n=1 Tax=Streptomyces sichuanensis TaxID=2871810 RepID=UPI001CE3B140|nr:winged helix-turn-helix transcriptional regulator [Streptomyces sichuanensis]MCA6090649.1 LuxR family transcriptional regulator [Streptomyces sichuanensis]